MNRGMLDPTTRPDYTPEELAFLKAMDTYKRKNSRPHPSVIEILAVAISQGYRLVAKPKPVEVICRPPQMRRPTSAASL